MARTQPPSKSLPSAPTASFEPRLVAALIAFTLLVTCLPYALGYFLAPVMGGGGAMFVGTPYNIDDYCNYLSWLRQMADGHFFIHNLFTTDPQQNIEFNVFFWLLGRVMTVTHCSPQAVLQFARIAGGLGLLILLYRFYRYCLPDDAVRFRLPVFGAGLAGLAALAGQKLLRRAGGLVAAGSVHVSKHLYVGPDDG